jgi:LuxR family transcriptional regulator, maltose regulon positive regulatory protein
MAMPPVVQDAILAYRQGEQNLRLAVDSVGWFAWLETASSFTFTSAAGHFTARREQSGHRRGGWYWKAYRKQHGKLASRYLGKSATLTLERLLMVAQALADAAATKIIGTTAPVALAPLVPPGGHATPRTSLLAAKVHAPASRTQFLARPHLVAQLHAGLAGTLTLISAPAGFGKTTLLTQWIAETRLPVAWLALDPEDNQPARFLTYLIAAIQTLHPQIGATALALLQTPQPAVPEAILTLLSNDVMREASGDFAVVLDDYHLIEAPPIHRTLTLLLEHLPPSMHIVIVTRADPPLPLARLRARGQLCEVRASDLRFATAEAGTFLQQTVGRDLEPATIAAIHNRTEGWVTGLQLAALVLRGSANVAAFLTAFTGSHRFVLAYLSEEVLALQPAPVLAFLLQTAILNRLNPSLCDAVTGQAGSQAMLETLDQANLFLIGLDQEHHWYRYHHLFADVLRNRLRLTHPAVLPELHQRASHWYEQHSMLAEAVQHALAAPDVARAVRLIEQDGWSLVRQGNIQTLLSWLTNVPDAVVRARPLLCAYHAIVLLASNQMTAAEARLLDADQALQSASAAVVSDLTPGWVALAHSGICSYTGDLVGSIAFAQQALDLLPATAAHVRASATMNTTLTYLLHGDVTPAMERRLRAAITPARASGNPFVFLRSISNLARLQALQGQLHQAATTYAQAVQIAPEQAGLRVRISGAAYYCGFGDLMREWNDLEAADYLLTEGRKIIGETLLIDADVVILGYTALARLQQARGDAAQALATVDAGVRLAEQRHFPAILSEQLRAIGAQVELASGNLAAARRWADSIAACMSETADYRYEPVALARARVRIAEQRSDPTRSVLSAIFELFDQLLVDAEAKARSRSVVEILTLRALALDAQGDRSSARAALERALQLGQAAGYVRLFLDEGSALIGLLRDAHAHSSAQSYVATLLSATGQLQSAIPGQHPGGLAEPLTERERDVLRLLVAGQSNAAIARALVITVGTVKSHVNHIYGKLGVTSRSQAIARAHALQIG